MTETTEMNQDRIASLQELIEADPQDPDTRYMLALEYQKWNRHEEALKSFRETIERFPDYSAAYFMAGQLLARLQRHTEARAVVQRGIEAAIRSGERHAQSEMQEFLDRLEEEM